MFWHTSHNTSVCCLNILFNTLLSVYETTVIKNFLHECLIAKGASICLRTMRGCNKADRNLGQWKHRKWMDRYLNYLEYYVACLSLTYRLIWAGIRETTLRMQQNKKEHSNCAQGWLSGCQCFTNVHTHTHGTDGNRWNCCFRRGNQLSWYLVYEMFHRPLCCWGRQIFGWLQVN